MGPGLTFKRTVEDEFVITMAALDNSAAFDEQGGAGGAADAVAAAKKALAKANKAPESKRAKAVKKAKEQLAAAKAKQLEGGSEAVPQPKSARSVVKMRHDGVEHVLCTLETGKVDQQKLNIQMSEGEKVEFWTEGSCSVHLTGYLVLPDPDEGDEIDDEFGEEYSDEDDSEDEDGSEDLEDDSEDDSEAESEAESEEEVAPAKAKAKAKVAPKPAAAAASKPAAKTEGKRKAAAAPEPEAPPASKKAKAAAAKPAAAAVAKVEPVKAKVKASVPAPKKAAAPEKKEPEKKAPEKKEPEKKAPEKKAPEKKVSTKKEKPQFVQNGVTITDFEIGTGKVASNMSTVTVKYRGYLESNKKEFDKGSIPFKIGKGEVIAGWEIGIKGMKVGGKRRLVIPAKLGYGKRGAPPDIPPNATLGFDVQLKQVT